MSNAALDMAALERAVRTLPADALATLRHDALSRLHEMGFPHQKLEDWKYTNLAPAVELSNAWLSDPATLREVPVIGRPLREIIEQAIGDVDAHWLVIANGVTDRNRLGRLADTGVRVRSSAEAGATPPLFTGEPMSRFNAALLRDVLQIEIRGGHTLDKPVGLLLIDDAGRMDNLSQTRVVIDIGEDARAGFVELQVSVGGNRQFANGVTELKLGDGARVDFVRLQQRCVSHFHVNRLAARLGRNSVLDHAAFDLGGALVRNDIDADIVAPGAAVSLHGLYLTDGQQHVDNHTRVDHRVGPSKSVADYRGILGGRSRCVWNGKAIVHSGADGTDAHQSNRNLLLSATAEIDTKPELEIYADDVKCSHGATVGQLDPLALFYMQTRGLDRRDATRVLTRAFAASAVDRLPVSAARKLVERAIDTRLNDLIDGEA